MTAARRLALVAAALAACRGAGGTKVTLRYHPPAGATYHYALEQQNSVKMETGPMARLPGQELTVHIYYTQAVIGPTAVGTGVTFTYDSTSMTPGGMAPALARMRGLTKDMVYDERMRVVSARFQGPGTGAELSPLTDQLERSVNDVTFPLPESAVGVGDSWTAEKELPLGAAIGASAPVMSRTTRTVKDIQVAGADTSVLLSVETTFPGGPVTLSQWGQTATLRISGTIVGEELYSLSKSTVVRSSTGGSMRINIKGREGMTMAMEQQTSLQLTGAN